MKNSAPDVQKEDVLKSAYQNAKKAKKKAKATYKAKLKDLKSKMKPYKQSLRDAEKAEKQAKAAYKALENKEDNGIGHVLEAPAAKFATTSQDLQQKKRGRQPGYSPKAAKAAGVPAKIPAKQGRQAKAAPAGGGDDLTKVKGVGDNIAVMLKANGIRTFADMAATSFERYKELLKANGMSKFREPSPWAARAAELANLPAPAPAPAPAKSQAKLAAEPAAIPKKRGRQPGFSPKAAKAAPEAPAKRSRQAKAAPAGGGDDLTKVKGVGDNIAVMLKANGIRTFADMAATSFERYKELLKANGMSKFREPSPWAARAAELANLPAPVPAQKAAPKAAAAPVKRSRQAKTVIDQSLVKSRTKPQAAKATAPATPKAAPANPDDLTLVKGVGARVAEALNREGIYTFAEMAATSLERYKELLKANDMSKFRDPSDWAQLAGELVNKK